MARLYPPVTEEVLSAFCLSYNDKGEKTGASINVSFNLNRAVANAEIAGIALRLRTISTNQYVITENLAIDPNTGKSEGEALSYSLDDGTCIFSITAENNPEAINMLKVGQFYKAQLAFIGLTGSVGYWSTVATIKCVAKPTVTIANYTSSDANVFTNEILGEYVQDTSTGDSSEKVYSYRFQLFDSANNLLDDTGVQLHNSSNDINSNSSTDEYYCYRELNEGESYYIVYSVTTINGLFASSPRYQIISADSIDPEDNITLMVSNGLEESVYDGGIPTGGFPEWKPWEEGLIKIYPDLNDRIEGNMTSSGENKAITGNFTILRSSSKDNFKTWQEVRRFRLNNEKPYTKIIYDYTVEQGITYRYAIQQFNRQKFYSKKVYSYKRNPYNGEVLKENNAPIFNDIIADFEDMFLYDGKRQLKVKFNPKVNSFKNDLQEQKIDTIGSKHPFIFRNGNVCYKEFPISGLISFQQDNANFFMNEEDYNQMKLERFESDLIPRKSNINITYLALTNIDKIQEAINNNIQLYIYKSELQDVQNISGHENLFTQEQKIRHWIYTPIKTTDDVLNYYNQGWTIYKKIEQGVENGELINKDYSVPKTYSKTDLTSENIMSERYFKLLVLDWLTDGKPKLFRSPTEGNYIVRLLNVSLTPKTELGRMIHEFNCTAYEIADFNYQSLVDLGLLSIEDPDEIEKQWFSKDTSTLFNPENKNELTGYYNLDLENKDLVGFQCTGFAPGDKIRIMTKDSATPLEVTIGTTGTYIYDDGQPIISIMILPIDEDFGDFPRNILLATSGYTNQKFDTIASINTHTQIGDQIVGPVNNYMGKTVVGSGLYYTSPNVDLTEDYKLIELTEDTYAPNQYYTFDKNAKTYNISSDEFDPEKIYYFYGGTSGEKLRISEILHLHAKRREIIPIFYSELTNPNSAGIHALTENEPLPQFCLTPFGQGYIRGKSTMPASKVQWNTSLGNLTEEELTKSRTIHELVDFVISKCNKDIFCLFEVYVPNATKDDWVPYIDRGFHGDILAGSIYGIYDPWLYEQQSLKVDIKKKPNLELYMGWWPKTPTPYAGANPSPIPSEIPVVQSDYGLYDPTLTFIYNEQNIDGTTNEKSVLIDLSDQIEITLDNIKPPSSIRVGNGVILEPIFRLQYIDYTIENENAALKNLKNIYLNIRAQAEENIIKYIAAINARSRGELLVKKYNILLQQLQDYENYKQVVNNLTDMARDKQITKLKQYFIDEKNLVNILFVQLHMLDLELSDTIGIPYTSDQYHRAYYEEDGNMMYTTKINYLDFFNSEYFNGNTPLIATKEHIFNEITSSSETGYAVAKAEIENTFIKHIQNSLNYNFPIYIDRIISKLASEVNSIQVLLDELGNKLYVSQYLELLDKKGHDLFFSNLEDDSFKNSLISDVFWDETDQGKQWKKIESPKRTNTTQPVYTEANAQVYWLAIKSSSSSNPITVPDDILNLKNTLITSSLWEKYFYFGTDDSSTLVELGTPVYNSITNKYQINDFNKYYPFLNLTSQISLNSECLLRSCELLNKINVKLDEVNMLLTNGGNEAQRKAEYTRLYSPMTYERSASVNFTTLKTELELGAVTINPNTGLQTINKPSHTLENIIDTLYMDPDMTKAEAIANIKSRNIFLSLPGPNNSFEDKKDLQALLANYLDNYLTATGSQSPYSIYKEICAYITYRDEHNNDLSDEQKVIIRNKINSLMNTSPYQGFITQFNQISTFITNQSRAYSAVVQGNTVSAAINELSIYVKDFNTLVRFMKDKINQFKQFRNRYINTSERYNVSDNIKEILWDEQQVYSSAQDRLNEIKNLFSHQLEAIQKDVLFEGYLDFLMSYIDYNKTSNTTNKKKYLQLLEEAEAMAQATVNEEFSPYNQNLIVQNAWKNYLDALATTYKTEIKERFS